MLKIQYAVIVVALIAAACNTTVREGTPTQARATRTETPTQQPTQTSMPTPTQIPDPPSEINFDVQASVPQEDLTAIRQGVSLAHLYIDSLVGEDATISEPFKYVVVATGAGNTDPGGGGGCCTAMAEEGARPFIDVLHPIWANQSYEGKLATAAHEYVHVWQSRLGCLSIHSEPMGSWLTEGMAVYISSNVVADTGLVEKSDLTGSDGYLPDNIAELLKIKPSTFTTSGAWWGYDVAYFAVDYLVAHSPNGAVSLEMVCSSIASGESRSAAFEQAFGISLVDFDQAFLQIEQLIPTPTANPTATATASGPQYTISGTVESVYGGDLTKYSISVCPTNTHICQNETQLPVDGGFSFSVPSGSYVLAIKFTTDAENTFWYSLDGVNKDEFGGTVIDATEQDITSINFQVP